MPPGPDADRGTTKQTRKFPTPQKHSEELDNSPSTNGRLSVAEKANQIQSPSEITTFKDSRTLWAIITDRGCGNVAPKGFGWTSYWGLSDQAFSDAKCQIENYGYYFMPRDQNEQSQLDRCPTRMCEILISPLLAKADSMQPSSPRCRHLTSALISSQILSLHRSTLPFEAL